MLRKILQNNERNYVMNNRLIKSLKNDSDVVNIVDKTVVERLRKFIGEPLNRITCMRMYEEIFMTFKEIFDEAELGISNETMNYISQMYYDSIQIGPHELDHEIFTQRARMSDISPLELRVLLMLFKDTQFGAEFALEIKRRG